MAQCAKPPLVGPASHNRGPVQVLAALLPFQLPIHVPGKAVKDGSNMERGFGLAYTWPSDGRLINSSLSLSLHSAFQINK